MHFTSVCYLESSNRNSTTNLLIAKAEPGALVCCMYEPGINSVCVLLCRLKPGAPLAV